MENYQQETLDTYERIAEQFAIQNKENESLKPLYKKFHDFLPSGRVYDLGCGSGRDAQALHLYGYDVFGFDYSQKMIEIAKRNYPHLYFQKANILTDFSKNIGVDGVWACASLLHFNLSDFKVSLQVIYDLLKRDGLFYVALKLDDVINETVIDGRYFKYYKVSEATTLLEEAGFEILHFERTPQTVFGNFYVKKK